MKFLLLIYLICCSLFSPAQKPKKAEINDSTNYQTSYIVIAGESVNFSELDLKAKALGTSIGIAYNNDETIYDELRGLILPDNSADEVYAGRYLIRREDEDRISIEMKDWYFLSKPDPENYSRSMIIIAGIYTDKERAQDRLKESQKTIPGAYIHITKIYMGYIH